MAVDLTYDNLQRLVKPYLGGTRTESRAFLAWFLESVYRLEPTEAEDCVCDGPDDKGVDGIYVDEDNSRIDIFQSKISQDSGKTLGDTVLKSLVGTLQQFETQDSTEALHASTGNVELQHRLEDGKVAELVGQGWPIRGVLVTNVCLDQNGKSYLSIVDSPEITVYDDPVIQDEYISPDHVDPIAGPATFNTFGYPVSEFRVMDAKVVIAPLSATELVKLEGIPAGELFDYNVRQSLGKTKVNRDIEKSVRDPSEHRHFMLYHNGLTVVADNVDTSVKDKITINNYFVVNGCQSLTVLWKNRAHVSEDLRVLGRLIELNGDSPLLDKITHNSNNQNGIKPRDFQSNNRIQLRLRTEFQKKYQKEIGYRISRGEEPETAEVIDNESAARVLLAFDVRQPWACHQTYRLFDSLHGDIFARPNVNATHIISRMDAFTAVGEVLPFVKHELIRKYTLTKYFLLYLLAEALETDEIGRELVRDPSTLLGDPIEAGARDHLVKAYKGVLQDLVLGLNYVIDKHEEKDDYFDYKRVLKSPTEIRELRSVALADYERFIGRDVIESFGQMWGSTSSQLEA